MASSQTGRGGNNLDYVKEKEGTMHRKNVMFLKRHADIRAHE
jgi:hypothetical protein